MAKLIQFVLLLALIGGLTACRAPVREPYQPSANSITLQDQQLLEIISLEGDLDEAAAQPDAEFVEIQRMFRLVDQEYAGFLARNPEHLESRLLYGKLLTRFHDLEGARIQFLVAAKLAEREGDQVAVIHQQLATISAEQGDYSRAIVFADNAVKIEPDNAVYQYGLGQVLAAFRQQIIDEEVFTPEEIDQRIMLSFATAIELDPESIPLQFRFGEAFYDVDSPDWQAALDHWINLSESFPLSPLQKDAVLLHQARCYIELGQPERARQITQDIQSPQLQLSAQNLPF